MSRFIVLSILSVCFMSSAALAGGDPIEKRQKLMEETRDAAKVIGGMLKEEKPFDANAAMDSLKVWEKTAAKAGDLFPEGSDTGQDTEAKAELLTDREGFNEIMADFGE